MKTRNILIGCLMIASTLITSSCKKLLEEDPKGLLSSSTFWNSDKNAISAVNLVYTTPMESPNSDLTWLFWIETAGRDFGHWDLKAQGMGNGTWTANNVPFSYLWNQSYRTISRANFVLSNIKTAKITESLKLRVEGEASFLRAMHYFNLVRAFGDVPLVLKQTDGGDDLFAPRSPVADVYKTIIADLELAVAQLPLRSASDPGRATKGAAQALLAKVYLTRQDYAKTVDLTSQVIASNEYALEPDFKSIFTAEKDNGKEWLFSYAASGQSDNTSYNIASFSFPNNLGSYGYASAFGNLVLSVDFAAIFDKTKDKRYTDMVWTQFVAPDGKIVKFVKGTGIYCKKYYDTDFSKNLALTRVNIPILRYSDVLLMYAEALNETTPLAPDAFAKLNLVRNRAGLANITNVTLTSKPAFTTEVLNERRREFMNENQRTWDLKRRGLFLNYVKQFSYSEHKDFMDLFPIPQDQIDANPNLVQNPGY